jgi:hypothetical protein
MSGGMYVTIIAVLIVLLILFILEPSLYGNIKSRIAGSASKRTIANKVETIPDESETKERLDGSPPASIPLPPGRESDTLLALGYTGGTPWDEIIQATELDPSTFSSQAEYVKGVRRFSSGANFTSVTDDNTNSAFTNFVGLQRPQHVPIGSTARQIPDIDENVLQRNHQLRFN